MEPLLYILIFQGILGGFDVLWNHEWQARLPRKPSAALEQKIHGLRELLYAVIFIGLAWYEWQGIWAWILFGVIFVEIVLTGWDFVTEDRTRVLSAMERVTHLVLSMTGGAYVALLIPILWQWSLLPVGLDPVHHGAVSYLLSMLGAGVFLWGLRDLLSGLHLAKAGTQGHGGGAQTQDA